MISSYAIFESFNTETMLHNRTIEGFSDLYLTEKETFLSHTCIRGCLDM